MKHKIFIVLTIAATLVFCASSETKIQQSREKSPSYQYNLGLFYLNNGNFDLAIKHLNTSLSLNPKHDLSLNALGLAYSMKGQFEESVKYFQRCLEVNPALSEARNNLGMIYQEMGLLDKAEQEYIKATSDKTYPSKELPYYNLAKLYHSQDRLTEALEYVDMSLSLNSRLAMSHNLKGIILERQEKIEEAVESYKKGIKITPEDINLNFNLAVSYFKIKEYEKAREIFEKIRPRVTNAEMKDKIDEYLKMMK
jgi:protein O-GlcNAc transferase